MTVDDFRRYSICCGQVACLALLLFVFGCEGSSDSKGGKEERFAFEGRTIRAAVPKRLELPEKWESILDELSAQTKAKYVLDEYDASGMSESADAYFSDGQPLGGGSLLVFPISQLAELVDRKLLAAIPKEQQTEENSDWQGLFKGLRDNIARQARQPVVVPLSSPVLVCYYRKDLLEQAGLSPPQTWDEYRKLLDKIDSWAPGMTVVEPWSEQFRTTMFLARAVSYAQPRGQVSLFFDIRTGEPLIDGPGFLRALEEAQQAVEKMPAETRNHSPLDCRRQVLSGKAALAIAFETGAENPVLPFPPDGGSTDGTGKPGNIGQRPESMQIGFCRLPGSREAYSRSTNSWVMPRGETVNRTTLTAFSGLCAGVSAGQTPDGRNAGWNLLRTLVIPQNIESAIPPAARSFCREGDVNFATGWVGEDLAPAEKQLYFFVVAESLRDRQLIAELAVVGRLQFRRALTDGLGSVLSGESSPAETLESVARKWRAISGEIGVRRVLNSYRNSLNLPPL